MPEHGVVVGRDVGGSVVDEQDSKRRLVIDVDPDHRDGLEALGLSGEQRVIAGEDPPGRSLDTRGR